MNSPGRPLLEFAGVSKRFCRQSGHRLSYTLFDMVRELRRLPPRDGLRDGEFWALRDVDFTVSAGEVVGVIGMNGSGKSTLMNLASGVLLPTTGAVSTWAHNVCRIDHAGVLSISETGRENILMQLAVFGIPPERNAEEIEIIARLAKLEDNLDQPVGTYSRGMRSRLGFAIYSRLNPDLFLADEALGGGDRRLKDQFQEFLEKFIADGGAMLLATHDTQAMQTLCQRVLLLDQGRQLLVGSPGEAIEAYNALAQQRGVDLLVVRQRPSQPGTSTKAVPDPTSSGRSPNGGRPGRERTPAPPSEGDAGPLTIESVRLVGPAGGDCQRGDQPRLQIRGMATESVSGVTFLVTIHRNQTRFAVSVNSPHCEVGPGPFEVECDLGVLVLDVGSYQVGLAVRRRGVGQSATRESTVEVLPRADDLVSPRHLGSPNGVVLATTWKQGESLLPPPVAPLPNPMAPRHRKTGCDAGHPGGEVAPGPE